MPNLRNAKKALRKSLRRYEHNKRIRTRVKRWIKKYMTLLKEGKKDEASKILPFVQKLIDKAAKRNIFHRNKASRMVSRLYRLLNQA